MRYKVFIDGQYGTTGLKIYDMLVKRDDLELLTIDEKYKKDDNVKKQLLNNAHLVFLCLPDIGSKKAVSFITNEKVKVIDASTAHRTNPAWTYGIPEINITQRKKIRNSNRVCVPGCHASGFIMAMKPLIVKEIISNSQKLICNSITGFSGGGKAMIEKYENGKFDDIGGQRPYCLTLNHKHLPEMKYILGLKQPPFFTPSVGNFKQGMLVMSYLLKKEFKKKVSKKELINMYKEYYLKEDFINIIEDNDKYLDDGFLNPMKCNNTNSLDISIYENDTDMTIISRLDNLGKGASGAAIQCMNIMLGFDEKKGLKMKESY